MSTASDITDAFREAKAKVTIRQHVRVELPMEQRNRMIDHLSFREGWEIESTGPKRTAAGADMSIAVILASREIT